MATDAPSPTFDSHGNLVAEWSITVRYDALRDDLIVNWRQEAGPYHKAKALEEHYAPQDLEDALAAIQRAVRIMGARRLF